MRRIRSFKDFNEQVKILEEKAFATPKRAFATCAAAGFGVPVLTTGLTYLTGAGEQSMMLAAGIGVASVTMTVGEKFKQRDKPLASAAGAIAGLAALFSSVNAVAPEVLQDLNSQNTNEVAAIDAKALDF